MKDLSINIFKHKPFIMDKHPEEESNIKDIENMFQNPNINKMNYKYHAGYIGSGRHYYPRPTPQDILFEEHNQYSKASYSRSQVLFRITLIN